MKRSNEPVDRDANSPSRSPGLSRADRERAARGGRSLWIDDADWNSKVWVRLRWLSGEAIEGRISACGLSELLARPQSGCIPGVPHADSRAQRGNYELVWDSVLLKPEYHEWLPDHIPDETVLTVVYKVDVDQESE